ncbi:MAG: FtsX-like permease family protein [Acidobacteriota bacterium]
MFTLRMAWRELRSEWKRLLFFFLCLAVGVGSIVTLRSVIQAVRTTMMRETRMMMGADLVVSSNRAWEQTTHDVIEQRLASADVRARTETVETLTMVRPADESKRVARMVEIVGVEPAYPLYGRFDLDGGTPYSFELLRSGGALVRADLLAQLGVGVGDAILVGEARLIIRGVVIAEPGRRAGAFSFGSRMFVSREQFDKTGLLGPGSRASFRLLVRVPDEQAEPIARDIGRQLRGQFVRVRSFRSAEQNTAEEFARAEDYLSLVGLVVVILGGVGVWSVVRVFMQQKRTAMAVLKCVGATSSRIVAVYLVQVMTLAVIGSLCGIGLAATAMVWIGPMVGRIGGIDVPYTLTAAAAAQGAGVGVLVAGLFALVPLLDVRHVKPSLLLRAAAPAHPRRIDWMQMAAVGTVAAGLIAVASWQAGSVRVGLIVSAGFALVVVVLNVAGVALIRAVRPLQAHRWFPLRYASRRVSRPGNQVRAILTAVGLGAFLVVGVRMVQSNLLAEFRLEQRPDSPDLFLVDVQTDQVAALKGLLANPVLGVMGAPQAIPVLRARIAAVRGASGVTSAPEDIRRRGLGREFTITYRAGLERNERVVDGQFWPPTTSAIPEVSVEQGVRDHSGVVVGDLIRFDVLGRAIEARVSSVRSVNWVDARAGGFMFVFRPGVLESAPQTYIAPVRGPAEAGARGRLQRAVVDAFPNVAVVDVKDVLETAARIVSIVTLAITVVGSLVLLTGMLILVGAISMTKFQRVYEAAILKTLGATSRFISLLLLTEYGLLGLLAGIIGAGGGLGLSWTVSRFVLKVAWHPLPWVAVEGVVVSTVAVAVVGVLASLDVLRRKPLATLRGE